VLGSRDVELQISGGIDGRHEVWLNAGAPSFEPVDLAVVAELMVAIGLTSEDSVNDLPPELASTGLRYLVLPVSADALARARIRRDIGPLLHRLGAEYLVLVDPQGLEQRHWTNDGRLEDCATGSAASVVGPWLVRHGRVAAGATLRLRQGRFTGRGSELLSRVQGTAQSISASWLGGQVRAVASGRLRG
jgi:trans-2,3-dihydro-3-hydroxyanthranilate isomerase